LAINPTEIDKRSRGGGIWLHVGELTQMTAASDEPGFLGREGAQPVGGL